MTDMDEEFGVEDIHRLRAALEAHNNGPKGGLGYAVYVNADDLASVLARAAAPGRSRTGLHRHRPTEQREGLDVETLRQAIRNTNPKGRCDNSIVGHNAVCGHPTFQTDIGHVDFVVAEYAALREAGA